MHDNNNNYYVLVWLLLLLLLLLLFLQVVILVVLIIGVLSSVGLIAANIYSTCHKDYAYSTQYSDSGSGILTGILTTLAAIITSYVIHLFSCFLFAWDVLLDLGHSKPFAKKKICFWLLIILIAMIISLGKVMATSFLDFDVKEGKLIFFLIFCHNLSMIVLCFCSAKILSNSLCSWKEASKNMKLGELRPGEENLSEIIEEKLSCLYYNYIKVGRKISLKCNMVKRWFVVMYAQCFLLVLVTVLELTNRLGDRDHKFTVIVDALVYFFFFFLPNYSMGMIVNKAHQNYHKKIINTYFGIEIVVEGHKYVCIPGKPYTEEELALNAAREQQWLAVTINQPVQNETSPLLQHTETEIEISTEEGEEARRAELADEKYKEYFKEALRVHKGLIMAKITEFDFIPFFIISFPLGSFLYTFTALSPLFSVIFLGYYKECQQCNFNFTEV